MVKSFRRGAQPYFAFAVLASFIGGCGGGGGTPVGPSGGSSPQVQTLYKNGVWGTWFGEAVVGSISNGGYGGGFSTVSLADNVDGDTQVLAVYANGSSGTNSCSYFKIIGVSGQDASAYESGHLGLDIMLGPGSYSSVLGFNSFLNSIGINTGALSSTAFTRVSLPLSSANVILNGGTYPIDYTAISVPFWYRGSAPIGSTSTTTQLYLNDIVWTNN